MDVVDRGGETGEVIADSVVHGAPGEPFVVMPKDDGVTGGCAVTVSAGVEGVADGVECSVASVGDVDAEGARAMCTGRRGSRGSSSSSSGLGWIGTSLVISLNGKTCSSNTTCREVITRRDVVATILAVIRRVANEDADRRVGVELVFHGGCEVGGSSDTRRHEASRRLDRCQTGA